jgi:hypothetical protein
MVRIDADGNEGVREAKQSHTQQEITNHGERLRGIARQPGGSEVFTSTTSRMCTIMFLTRAKKPGSALLSRGFAIAGTVMDSIPATETAKTNLLT